MTVSYFHTHSATRYELEWSAWDRYEERKLVFVPAGESRWVYRPSEEPALVTRVAHLNRVSAADEPTTREAYLLFFQDFGLLGESALKAGRRDADPCDSYAWVKHHAYVVDMSMCLAKSILARDADTVNRLLEPAEKLALSVKVSTNCKNDVPSRADDAWVFGRHLIEYMLNCNMRGVDRAQQDGVTVFLFDTLIQLVYWRLADDLWTRPIKECALCGLDFFAYDTRQKFCSAPPRLKESRCASRHRFERRQAQTQAKQEKRAE